MIPPRSSTVLLGESQAADEALPLCPTLAVTFCNGLFFIVLGLCYIGSDNTGLTSAHFWVEGVLQY